MRTGGDLNQIHSSLGAPQSTLNADVIYLGYLCNDDFFCLQGGYQIIPGTPRHLPMLAFCSRSLP